MSPFRLWRGDQRGKDGEGRGAPPRDIYAFSAKRNDGTVESLSAYRGKLLLIVNVASQCGFTPQYTGLEEIYRKFRDRGFEILAFPCNQFGHQEPGSDEEIRAFCDSKYAVTFPLFGKIEVNGPRQDPLYEFLKEERGGLLGGRIKWNFTKFLIDRNGRVIGRYAPSTRPEEIANAVEAELEKEVTGP